MPEPLTFDISLPGDEWICMQVSLAQAVKCFREGGYVIQPSRPIVPEDFRGFDQRCDLSVLGYSSRDVRPVYEYKPYIMTTYVIPSVPDEAYASLGLNRNEECERIAEWCTGINGLRVEEYVTKVKALDDAVLEVYRRRAVV